MSEPSSPAPARAKGRRGRATAGTDTEAGATGETGNPPQGDSTTLPAETGTSFQGETGGVGDTKQPSAARADTTVDATPVPGQGILLQDWTPLGHCLDYQVGRMYWSGNASDLFADNRVPTLIHDSGSLSQRGARVLYAWCAEQEQAGTLPDEIVIVEIGMGTGLHLRYLLDAFRDRCRLEGKPYYDRLVAIGTDYTPDTVRKALSRGLFAPHAGHVRLGFMDMMEPGLFGEIDTGNSIDLRGRIHWIVCQYVLDLLPLDVFRRQRDAQGKSRWDAVWVRTWLRHLELLPAYSDRTADELVALARQADSPEAVQLANIYSLMFQEMRLFPVDLSNHPDIDELERMADHLEATLGPDHELLQHGTIVNYSGQAVRAAQLMGLALAPNGFATIRDVAFTTPESAAAPRSYIHYGPISSSGVNFVELDSFFAAGLATEGLRLLAPHHDGLRSQGARLVTRAPLPATEAEYKVAFDGEAMGQAQDLADEARQDPNPMTSLEKYRQAILLEPTNWHLLAEAARSALHRAGQADVAVAIALKGLEINESYSPDLWNVLGDAQYARGQHEAARLAYLQGLQVHPRHARLHYCLAWVEAERGRYATAFEHLGHALACDRLGAVRAEVLQLLDVCLRGQAAQFRAERERLAGRDAAAH